jgi:hypothetical protein
MTTPKEFIVPKGMFGKFDETDNEFVNSLNNFKRVMVDGNYNLTNTSTDYKKQAFDDALMIKKYMNEYAGKSTSDAPITISFFKKVILSKIKSEVTVYLGTLDRSDPSQSLIITAISEKLTNFSSDEEAQKQLMKDIGRLDSMSLKYMFLGGAKPNSLNSYNDLGSLFVDKFVKIKDDSSDPVLAKDVKSLSLDKVKELNIVAESEAISGDSGLVDYDDLTEEQLLNINQCALISSLMNGYSNFGLYPLTWADPSYGSNRMPFGGRIYPVVENNTMFDPNTLVNICTTSRRTKKFLLNPKSNSQNLYHKLFWVYSDSETGKLRETEIFLNTNVDDFKLEDAITLGQTTTARAKIVRQTMSNGYGYSIKNVKIDYNGTNPSTAAKDVKVTLKIELDSLKSIDAVCSFVKMGRGEEIELKIYDLVTLPATQNVETINQGGGVLKREYSPEYSRIRLKVWSLEDTGNTHYLDPSDTEDAMIIDLATIDHKLTRSDDAAGKTSLEINYAGYFEQSMKDPYNDALAGEEIIMNRWNRRKDANKQILDNGCSDELARDMFQIINETDRVEAEDNIKKGSIIKRMFENGRVYGYELDEDLIKENVIGSSLSPKQVYVTSFKKLGKVNTNVESDTYGQWFKDVFTNLEEDEVDIRVSETGEVEYTVDSANLNRHFFYLGDLMYESLSCIYKDKTADMRDFRKNLNLRFVVGTFSVPDPKDITKTTTLNPLRIPVDMKFFLEWFHESIVSKGMTSYPVGLFIKDLVQRLINKVIYETCFSVLAPDETPPQLRANYFVDHRKDWFKTKALRPPNGTWFDPRDPTGQFTNSAAANNHYPNILMTKRVNSHVQDSKNYCVIYQQFPSYFRQLKYERAGKLKEDPYTMTIYYGNNTKNTNYISNVSFSKTDSPHLREARYFNSNFGSLSLLANVYDLSFEIKSPKAITCLYPGNIINFILTDWSGETEHWFPQDMLGESDPHNAGTRANILGFGGYYVIKSVNYSLETNLWNAFKISISCKFLGTDAVGDEFRRNPDETKFASESPKCLEIRNSLVEKLNTLEKETGIEGQSYDMIYSTPSTEAGTDASRVPEVPDASSAATSAPAAAPEVIPIPSYDTSGGS